MSKIIKSLAEHNGYNFTEAATGTIYLTKGEEKIRIGDHEPNDSLSFMRGGKPTMEIYTVDASNKTLIANDAELIDVLVDKIEGFQLTPAAKALVTKNDKAAAEQAKLSIQAAAKNQAIEAERLERKAAIAAVVAANKSAVAQMLADAEAYSKSGSNGDKRRKLRASHFKKSFQAAFGFEVAPGEIAL
jgi:hypothetical protein